MTVVVEWASSYGEEEETNPEELMTRYMYQKYETEIDNNVDRVI